MVDRAKCRRGFTLVELLVVIGIIALLVGILIPVVSKVRARAYEADTRNWLSQLQGAIERYHADFRAYPGPLSYMQVYDTRTTPAADSLGPVPAANAPGFDLTWNSPYHISGSENLVLGLLGGLRPNPAGGNPPFVYDPTQVGLGPLSLNAASRNAKRYPPYLDATNLDWQTINAGKTGHYFDDATGGGMAYPTGAGDTIIPEFVDKFPQPMPILYLRSRVGVDPIPPKTTVPANWSATFNSVITNDPTNRSGPYDLSQIIGYTDKNSDGAYIGVGREVKVSDYVPKLTTSPPLPHGLRSVVTTPSGGSSLDKNDTTNYQYPYDAFGYFLNPNFKGIVQDTANYSNTPLYPRQKDAYILISPGRDRTYGTNDDICSFGDVNP